MPAVTDKDYSTYQDIREEAGHQHLNKLEELSGLKNGSNTIFYAKRTYIVDRNYNDTLDVSTASGDVIVYVNDVAVTVNAINAETGAITLAAAPANGATVLGTYYHSLLSDAKIDKYRKEAMGFIQRKISGIIAYADWTDSTIPAEIKTVCRLYAAALILIRDHGLNADTENSSKDGYKKLATAKSLLTDYLGDVADASGTLVRTSVSARSDGNIFRRETNLTDNAASVVDSTPDTEHFMRGD